MDLKTSFTNIINILNLEQNFAVAISGGIDSVVLLHLAAQWAKKSIPAALHVNHGLRLEAEKEVLFISEYAKQLGTKCYTLNWEKEKEVSSNVQSKAREARYRLLTEWCNQNETKYLLVAHNLNDQAETLFMRLERGSGIDGLSAMKDRTFFNGICILRPLLSFSRSILKEYALKHNLKWIEDPSNQDNKYRRTTYRNFLKTNDNQETLIERIHLTTMHMKRAIDALMHYTRLAFDQCLIISTFGYIEIKLPDFYQLPEEIAARVLVYSLMAVGNKHYKPRYSSFSNIFNQIWQRNYNKDYTLHGCAILKDKDNIMILIETAKIADKAVALKQNETMEYEWDHRFTCKIKNNQCDQTAVISTLKRHHKIPEHLKKIHHKVLYTLPILLKNKKILAYPQINRNNNMDDFTLLISKSLVRNNIMKLTYMNEDLNEKNF